MLNINTNLGILLEGITTNQIKSIDKLTVLTINDNELENIKFVQGTLNKLVHKIYIDFKNKTINNANQVIDKYQSYIDTLNNSINMENIRIKTKGNYCYIYWYDIQLAYFSFGNSKLEENEFGEGFIIWNIIGKFTCNGKTKLCSKYCYNNCKEFENNCKTKINNFIFSLLDIFEPAVNKMMFQVQHRYSKMYFRIHEDGDFYNSEYFNKWVNITKINTGVQFMAYTKEPSLLKDINLFNSYLNNFVLRYSVMEDTNRKVLNTIEENNIPCYVVLGKKPKKMCNSKEKTELDAIDNALSNTINHCVKSCKYCKKCYNLEVNRIFTTMH